MVFLCQAEDGIRDLVRSRGLGDVYKRQAYNALGRGKKSIALNLKEDAAKAVFYEMVKSADAVSYTHLTLPTSDLV